MSTGKRRRCATFGSRPLGLINDQIPLREFTLPPARKVALRVPIRVARKEARWVDVRKFALHEEVQYVSIHSSEEYTRQIVLRDHNCGQFNSQADMNASSYPQTAFDRRNNWLRLSNSPVWTLRKVIATDIESCQTNSSTSIADALAGASRHLVMSIRCVPRKTSIPTMCSVTHTFLRWAFDRGRIPPRPALQAGL